MGKAVLECESIGHTFGRGELAEPVLCGLTASFAAGEACVGGDRQLR